LTLNFFSNIFKKRNIFLLPTITEPTMLKALIVYGSTTGNTQALASLLEEGLSTKGYAVTLLDASNAKPENICQGYDLVLLGCSAWGDDEIVLQDDFEPFFQQLHTSGVAGHKCACFATGDSSFTYFCGAADTIEKRLEELGGQLIMDSLKIEGSPSPNDKEVQRWLDELVAAHSKEQ
jgi:flavodoxin I